MKIATWNINECVGITTNLADQKTVKTVNSNNIHEIIEKINEYDFDVICFQEYLTYINESESLTEELITKTKLKYYETYDTYDSFLFEGGRSGVAIFSKYDIKDSSKVLFGNPDMTKQGSSGVIYHSVDKGIIKVKITIENDDYTIITGHAMAFAPFGKTEFDYPESYKPLKELIMDCKEDKLIVLGDFNTEKLFELMPEIKAKVRDIVDCTTTKSYYEGQGEIQRDYILINNNLKYEDKYKIDNFSDHYIIGANIF